VLYNLYTEKNQYQKKKIERDFDIFVSYLHI